MDVDFPIILFETEQDWISWLEKNGSQPGIWIRIGKKNSGLKSINYQQALDIAICYGWIDGIKKKYDELAYIQRFTPRKAKSNWSKINKEKAERFIAEGKMKPEGWATIENAKVSGSWDHAYDSQKNAKIPSDFEVALQDNLEAKKFFETLDRINRYSIFYRIQVAKSKEAREKKIRFYIEMLEKKQKFH